MPRQSNDPVMNELQEFLGNRFQILSPSKKQELCKIYKEQKRSDGVLLFMWLFSFHYAYVGKWKLFFAFFFTLGGIMIWWVIDFFRLDTILKEYNSNKAEELLKNIEEA